MAQHQAAFCGEAAHFHPQTFFELYKDAKVAGVHGLVDKDGSSEVIAILPGFPDNVRVNEEGDF